jgi:carboxyl-terminal processing protease
MDLVATWKPVWRRARLSGLAVFSIAALATVGFSDQAKAEYDQTEAAKVLSYGMRAIETRSLKPENLSDIVVEGLRGLATVDAEISVTFVDKKLAVYLAGVPLGTWAEPVKDTPEAWTLIVLDVLETANAKSWRLQRMNAEELYQAYFDSALAQLDPFSRYAGREEAETQQERRNGFGGLGIRYRLYRYHLEVTRVLEETPATSAGLKPGDHIVQVNETPINSLSSKEVHDLLRGPVDSDVTLILRKHGIDRIVTLKRGLVSQPTVFMETAGDIPRLRITRFSQQTADFVHKFLLASFPPGHTHPGLILDLRGNPGGLLDQAVNVSDLFIAEGDIVSTRGRHPNTLQRYQATRTDVPGGDILKGLPILILIDGRTASAAEILAAALQSSGRAVVAGTTSYGKGTVQTVVAMPNGGEMTLTWSRFYTPSGYALHGLGVLPTLCTSESRTTPEELMQNLAMGTLPAVINHREWLKVPLEDHEGRRQLRMTCPPADHANRDALDLDIAQAILQTPGAYQAALAAIHASFTGKQ